MAICDQNIMAGPSDWLQFYRQNLTGEEQSPSPPPPPSSSSSSSAMFGGVSDPLLVTPVTTPGTGSNSSLQLNPESRRVARPNRRRSRASRRAPTTLLNTDTTNFRAMVQQFTGVPSAPFTTGPQAGATNFNFAAPATVTAPGYHLQQQQQHTQQQFQQQQQHQQQQQQQHQQQFQQQQLQYMLSMNKTASDVFRPRFSDGNQ